MQEQRRCTLDVSYLRGIRDGLREALSALESEGASIMDPAEMCVLNRGAARVKARAEAAHGQVQDAKRAQHLAIARAVAGGVSA